MIKLWDWDTKKRTMLRFIKNGHIFAFEYEGNTYIFGRIVSRTITKIGTIVEFFDYISNEPVISEEIILKGKRMMYPVNLDIYALFDKKTNSEWRIIGLQENYVPDENLFFWIGGYEDPKKIDVYGRELGKISEEERQQIQDFVFQGEERIRPLIKNYIETEGRPTNNYKRNTRHS